MRALLVDSNTCQYLFFGLFLLNIVYQSFHDGREGLWCKFHHMQSSSTLTPFWYAQMNMSSCTNVVLLTCKELGVECELFVVDLFKGEHKNPQWIETKHPFGAVPLLIVRSFSYFTSFANTDVSSN